MRSDRYQIALIFLGMAAALFFGIFFYREIFPEYRIYQDDYIALQDFHSKYSGEPPPAFQTGIKQIVFEREDKGPALIDRCTSCHVALQIPDFSSTKIARDINGNIIRDDDGTPVKVANENYIWANLDEKINQLSDPERIAQLRQSGEGAKAEADLAYANKLKSLKTARVGGHVYDVEKVLAMHPLIGKEIRPFEFHPLDEYGCTSCHGGNGRGLTTDKAHGPVFDDEYETEYMGPKPEFLERDSVNDPAFAKVFNHKPGDALLFQTTPILVGHLIESKCIQCHEQSSVALQGLANTAGTLAAKKRNQSNAIKRGYDDEKLALLALMDLKNLLSEKGLEGAIGKIRMQLKIDALPQAEYDRLANQLEFLQEWTSKGPQKDGQEAAHEINAQIISMLGSGLLEDALDKILKGSQENQDAKLDQFLQDRHLQEDATGTLFSKWTAVNLEKSIFQHIEDTQKSLNVLADEKVAESMASDVDLLTKNHHRGSQLYIAQACYACHRIAGIARGGVGPELTRAGNMYPWYMKEKLVWPQGSLATSTMPNMHLDHVEVEDLMTYLFSQNGPGRAVSETDYKIALQQWEAGRKAPFEKPIPPSELRNLRYSMTVFATEGCASCHRLVGYQSNIGYSVEKEKKGNPGFKELFDQRQWFRKLFPEFIKGSEIVKAIEANAAEIDKRIIDNVREGSLLEEIDAKFPQTIESLYSQFRFASRARDHQEALKKQAWKNRVHRILMMYIQEYGLGRVIGPRPNWSGVYRSDQWLMEHFRNPAAHIPKSIMPAFPFDDSKFAALTYMLDVLGRRNRDSDRSVWQHEGFDPALAYQSHCAQCHGDYMQGNGPVAEWIYPIPKNLRNAEFLRNLTRANAIDSITHGVKGTPMPPWGETPKDKENGDGKPIFTQDEINALADWIYSTVPGAASIKGGQDVPKWMYMPGDVVKDLEAEGAGGKKEEEIFDAVPVPTLGSSKHAYFIKKEYYTQSNIEAGKHFFNENCAICHGADADGSGLRAGIMQEAKPRMLTNLDWINSRDDLRLLRSIKYGVPGTSMTPWGDLTSAQQRIQLVIFIRSLSREQESREQLAELHYKAFNTSMEQLESARAAGYASITRLRNELESIRSRQNIAFEKASENPAESKLALEGYKKQIELAAELKKDEEADHLLVEMKAALKKESDIYLDLGIELNRSGIGEAEWSRFLDLLALNQQRYSYQDGKLILAKSNGKQVQALAEEIAQALEKQIATLGMQQAAVEGKIVSKERTDELNQIEERISALRKLKRKLLSGIEETMQLRQKQAALYDLYQNQVDLGL